MASIIRAVRTLTGDSMWFIKLAFAVSVVYLAVNHSAEVIPDENMRIILYAVLILLFFGSAVSAMNRNLNNKRPLIPGLFNIFDVLAKLFGGLISILPGALIAAGVSYFISTQNLLPLVKQVLYGLTGLMTIPFMLIPLVLYSAGGKIKDAFRMDLINASAGNFLVNLFLFIFQFAAVIGLSFIIIYFFVIQMFKNNQLSISLLIYIYSVIAFYSSLIYFSDLYDDVILALDVKDIREVKDEEL